MTAASTPSLEEMSPATRSVRYGHSIFSFPGQPFLAPAVLSVGLSRTRGLAGGFALPSPRRRFGRRADTAPHFV